MQICFQSFVLRIFYLKEKQVKKAYLSVDDLVKNNIQPYCNRASASFFPFYPQKLFCSMAHSVKLPRTDEREIDRDLPLEHRINLAFSKSRL